VLCGLEASSGVPAAAAVCPVVEDEEDEVEDDDAVAAERVVASGSRSTHFSSAVVEPDTSPSVLSEGGETISTVGGAHVESKERQRAYGHERWRNARTSHRCPLSEKRGGERPVEEGSYKFTTLTRITCNMEKEHLPEGVGREPLANGTAAAVGRAARVAEDAEVDEDEETSTPESGERGVPAPPEELEFVEEGAKAADDSGRPAAPEEFELGDAAESRG
jgi:hypothetical protein